MRVVATPPPSDMPAHVLAQLLDAKVLDDAATARFHQLFAERGLSLAAMVGQGARLPLSAFREVLPALDADQAAQLGYQAGDQARLTSYASLSLPLVSAGSVAEVLQLLAFIPLISNSLTARFVSRADDVVVMLSANSGDPVLDRFPVFYSAAALMRLLRILVSDAPELSIHIAWPQPAGFRDHPEVLAGRLQFDALVHHIVVPRVTLEAVCRFSDPIAYQVALRGLEAALAAQCSSEPLSARLKALLDAQHHRVAIEDAAQQLHLSVSTLKRRLAEAGTTFRALRDEVLMERALILMTDPTTSLEATASALGYSDLSNFSHAFKRWTGCSPATFRRRARGRADFAGL